MTKKYILTEEQKRKYAEKAKKKYASLTGEEKEEKYLAQKKLRKANNEKYKQTAKAWLKQKMLDPEYRSRKRELKKKAEKKAKEKNPFITIGKDLKKNAKHRNIDAPHKPLEYREWYKNHIKICYYCGNNNETIRDYLKKIGEKVGKQQNRLQVERIDSIKGYLLDNLTLACSICNTHKSDIVSAEDFKEIAQKYIAPKIKNELGNTKQD